MSPTLRLAKMGRFEIGSQVNGGFLERLGFQIISGLWVVFVSKINFYCQTEKFCAGGSRENEEFFDGPSYNFFLLLFHFPGFWRRI
jgi:hypothetical protein